MIAREAEHVPHPVAERRQGIRVVAAVHQDQRVHGDQHVGERRQRKTACRPHQQRHCDQHRHDLEEPRQPVVRTDAGPHESEQHDGGEDQGQSQVGIRVVHGADYRTLAVEEFLDEPARPPQAGRDAPCGPRQRRSAAPVAAPGGAPSPERRRPAAVRGNPTPRPRRTAAEPAPRPSRLRPPRAGTGWD